MSKKTILKSGNIRYSTNDDFVIHCNNVGKKFGEGFILYIVGGVIALIGAYRALTYNLLFVTQEDAVLVEDLIYITEMQTWAIICIFGILLVVLQFVFNRLKSTRNASIATMIYTAQLIEELKKIETAMNIKQEAASDDDDEYETEEEL